MAEGTAQVSVKVASGGGFPEAVTVAKIQGRADKQEVQLEPVSTDPGADAWLFTAADDVSLQGLLDNGLKVAGVNLAVSRQVIRKHLVVAWAEGGTPLSSIATTKTIAEELDEQEGQQVTIVPHAPTGDYTFEAADEVAADKIVAEAVLRFKAHTVRFKLVDAAPSPSHSPLPRPPAQQQPLAVLDPPAPQQPPAEPDPREVAHPPAAAPVGQSIIHKIEIFHDAENCPIPSGLFERGPGGNLIMVPHPARKDVMRPKVKAGKVPPEQQIRVTRLYDAVVRSVLARVEGEAAANAPDRLFNVKVRWDFVLHWSETNPFHPHKNVKEDFVDLDVSLVDPGTKKGAVDTMLHKLLATGSSSVEKRYRMQHQAEKDGVLIVLISGDRDFAGDVQGLRTWAHGQPGLRVLIMSSRDSPAKEAFLRATDLHLENWTELVDAARDSSPRGPQGALSEAGGSDYADTASSSTIPGKDSAIVAEIKVTKPMTRFLRQLGGLDDLQSAVGNFHWAFVVVVIAAKQIHSRDSVVLKVDTASVGSAVGAVDQAPPTPQERAGARQAVEEALQGLKQDDALRMPGVTGKELVGDPTLAALAQAKRVCCFIPGISGSPASPCKSGGLTNSSCPIVLKWNQVFVDCRKECTDQDITNHCWNHTIAQIKVHQIIRKQDFIILAIDLEKHNGRMPATKEALLRLQHPHIRFSLQPPAQSPVPDQCQVQLKYPPGWATPQLQAFAFRHNLIFQTCQQEPMWYAKYASLVIKCNADNRRRLFLVREPGVSVKDWVAWGAQQGAPAGEAAAPSTGDEIKSDAILVYWQTDAGGAAEVRSYLNRKAICTEALHLVQDISADFARLQLLKRSWHMIRKSICVSGLSQLHWDTKQLNAPVQLRGSMAAVEEAIAALQEKTREVDITEEEGTEASQLKPEGVVVRTLGVTASKPSCHYAPDSVRDLLKELTELTQRPEVDSASGGLAYPGQGRGVGGRGGTARRGGKGPGAEQGRGRASGPEAQAGSDTKGDDESDSSDSGDDDKGLPQDGTGMVRSCLAFSVDKRTGAIKLAFFPADKDRADELEEVVQSFVASYAEDTWQPPKHGHKEAVDAMHVRNYLQTLSDDFDLRSVRWQDGQHSVLRLCGDLKQIQAAKQHLTETCSAREQGVETVKADSVTLALLRLKRHEEQLPLLAKAIQDEFGKRGVHVLAVKPGGVKGFVLKMVGPTGPTAQEAGPVTLAKRRGEELVKAFRAQMGEVRIELVQEQVDYLAEAGKDNLKFMLGRGCCWQLQQPRRPQFRAQGGQGLAAQAQLSNGCIVQVWCGDVLAGDLGVAAVVNSANVHLEHRGGIAHAIEQAAGPGLTTECSQRLSEQPNGKLRVGQVVSTSAHGLAAKGFSHVLHAAPPPFTSNNAAATAKMEQTVLGILKLATELALPSVVMPTLGAGIFKWPLQDTVECLFSGINSWLGSQACVSSSLQRLVLMDLNPSRAMALAERLQELCGGAAVSSQQGAASNDAPQQPERRLPKMPKNVWYWRQDKSKVDSMQLPEQFRMDEYIAYDYDQIQELEAALERGDRMVELCGDIRGVPSDSVKKLPDRKYATYDVDFDEHSTNEGDEVYTAVQRNRASGFPRGIRKVELLSFLDAKEHIPLFADDCARAEEDYRLAQEDYEQALEQHRRRLQEEPSGRAAPSRGRAVASWLWRTVTSALGASPNQEPQPDHVPGGAAAAAADDRPVGPAFLPVADGPGSCGLLLVGPPAELGAVESKVRKALADAMCESGPINLGSVLKTDSDLDSLVQFLAARRLEAAKVRRDPAGGPVVRVQILGMTNLLRAEKEVGEWRNCRIQDALEVLAQAARIPYPEEWGEVGVEVASKEGARYEEVQPGTEEYALVERRMRDVSGPQGAGKQNSWTKKITKVERVINPVGFAAYHRRCTGMAKLERNKGQCNEVWVKHGTQRTSPQTICASPGGLDYRYCDAGMFGRATYTAEDAVYSDAGYRFNLASGTAQLILVRAAAGTVHELPYGTTSTKLVRAPDGFDSVRGEVLRGFFALMLYETGQAYPAYLVTYET